MNRAALILGVLAVAAPARADDTFEQRATGANRVTRLDDVVWALTATCDSKDDVRARQCRQLRDKRAAALAKTPLIIEADPGAFTVGAYDAAKKSATLTLSGCIRCGGVTFEGKTYALIVGAPKLEGAALRPTPLYDTARTFPDVSSRDAWTRATEKSRVEVVVKIPAKPTWSAGGKQGITFDLVAYRVIEPCSGDVVLAAPVSQAVKGDKTACATRPASTPANRPAASLP